MYLYYVYVHIYHVYIVNVHVMCTTDFTHALPFSCHESCVTFSPRVDALTSKAASRDKYIETAARAASVEGKVDFLLEQLARK